MKKYKVTVHFRYDQGNEKDHETHEVFAYEEVDAEREIRGKYDSRYSIFKVEIAEIMTKEKMFNLTKPR